MKRRSWFALVLGAAASAAMAQAQGPEALVNQLSNEVLEAVRADKAIQSRDSTNRSAPLSTDRGTRSSPRSSRSTSAKANLPSARACSTVTTQDHHHLIAANLVKHFGGEPQPGRTAPPDAPAPTVLAQGRKQALVTSHLAKLRGTCNSAATDEPLATVSTGGSELYEIANIGNAHAAAARAIPGPGLP